MTVVHKEVTTYQSDQQYQPCDSMEDLESEIIMEDVEHQVHGINIV